MKALPAQSMFADLMTLLWIDMRGVVNSFGRIHREPLRFVGWFFWSAFFFWKLVLQPHGIATVQVGDVGTPIDIAASILLLVASISLVRGEHPAIAFFASPLEARWMSGSQLRPWISVAYLQLRNIMQRLPSFAIFLVFVLSYCMPPTHSLMMFTAGIVNVTMLTLCSRIFSLPRELAPLYLRVPLIALGVVSGCYALVGGVEAAARLLEITYTLPAFVPALHPGLAFVYGARGDMRVMLAAGSVLIACLSFLVIFSRDRYPELYEISRAGWEVRSRFREGRMREAGDESVKEIAGKALARIPAGAAVLLWTNWQVYRRQNMRPWPVIRPLLAISLGVAVAALHIPPGALSETFGLLFALTTTFSSLLDATRIGITIRHPIFWLTSTSFTVRLTTIVFSWYWRSALDIVLFGAGAMLAGAPCTQTGLIVLVVVLGVWLQRCIGLAAFAILPSKVDIGGPTALARFALAMVLAFPPLVLGSVAAALLHAPVPGYTLGGVLALCEAQALIFYAGRLLDGRFDKILQ